MIHSQRWIIREKREVALEDFEFDETDLGPRGVAIEVEYTAVSPGTECANYLALDPDVYSPTGWCRYPWQPGYAGIGHVIGKGEAVNEFALGDRIIGWFGHGRHAKESADWTLAPAHPELDPKIAPYTRMLGIAMNALEATAADPFAPVGVWGLGLIGNFVAQLLQNAGFRVIGIDPVAERRAIAERCGLTKTLDSTAPDFAEQLRDLAPDGLGVGVDVVGQAAVTMGIPEFLAQRGQMILMTHWRSQPPVDGNDFVHHLFRKGITLRGALDGSNAGLLGPTPGSDWVALQRQKYARLQLQSAEGRLQIEPLISHVVTPQQCREVYEGLCFDRDRWWGAVVDWRN